MRILKRAGEGILRQATAGVSVILLLSILAGSAHAVVDFSAAVDRSVVAPGDRINLEVTISSDNRNIPGFDLPVIPGVQISETGSQQNFQMVNNAVTISKTWTYSLLITAVADFQIPALEIEIEGRPYRSETIPITVRGAGAPSGPGDRISPPMRDHEAAMSEKARGEQRFVTIQADRDTAYVGEQIILSVRYYEDSRSRGFDRPQYTPPRTEGFWREELSPNGNFSEMIDGRRFNVTEIRYALFPTRDGLLSISPARIVIPQDPFAGFFNRNRGARNAPQQIETSGLRILVRPLPQPRPADFSGVVSRQLDLTVRIDRDSVPAGDALSLRIELQADGSLKTLSGEIWTAPEDVRAHAAGQEFQSGAVSGRFYSSLSQEWVLVPLEVGQLRLPAMQIRYFDPAREQYRTLSRPLETITVTEGTGNLETAAFSGVSSGELARLADDLAFVHVAGGRLRPITPPLDQRPLWWVLVLLPFLLLLVLRINLMRLDQEKRDPAGTRRRRALSNAQKALVGLERLDDPLKAHAGLALAINTYVADRLGRAPAGLRTSDIRDYAESLGQAEIGLRLQRTVESCDSVRFAGAAETSGDAFSEERERVATDLMTLEKAVVKGQSRGGDPVKLLLLSMLLILAPGVADRSIAADALDTMPIDGNPERLLAEGVQAYTAGDLDKALTLFQAADRQVDDATVYYNLGNTYARRGEIGMAVLNYERALRLTPRDGDLRANLQRVRARGNDARLHGNASPILLRLLAAAVGRLSRDEWDILLAISAWWLCLYLAFAWWRGGYINWYRRILIASVAVFLTLIAISGTYWYRESMRQSAVVVLPEVDVRSGPEASFPVVFKIHDGLILEIAGRREDWLQISLGGEWNGWVPNDTVIDIKEQTDR